MINIHEKYVHLNCAKKPETKNARKEMILHYVLVACVTVQ